jgi:thiamine pyrophosphokinase
MAELVDALDSGSSRGNSVDVRLILAAILFFSSNSQHINLSRMDAKQTYALIAAGDMGTSPALEQRVRAHQSLVCVDGGLVICQKLGLVPDLIVGDFDSVPPEVLSAFSTVPVLNFPVDKDESDLELAIQNIYNPRLAKITVFGATGKRMDHTLANLQLMRRYPGKVFFETEGEILFAIDGDVEIPCTPGQGISFIQMDDQTAGVTTEGLKWELKDAHFSKYFFSLSNVCLSHQVRLTLTTGDLICCMQKTISV